MVVESQLHKKRKEQELARIEAEQRAEEEAMQEETDTEETSQNAEL